MRTIAFYKLSNGNSPVEEFLDALQDKVAQKVTWTLQLIEEMDQVPSQYLKKLVNTDNIWEVRVAMAGNAYRILCFFDGNTVLVLNHAFQKKKQKTPQQAIRLAEKRKNDYLQRRKG
jgi:phage-related protein